MDIGKLGDIVLGLPWETNETGVGNEGVLARPSR